MRLHSSAACHAREGERPPQPGLHYKAFVVVHPQHQLTLAIGHRDSEKYVVDLIRDGLTVDQSEELTKAYGINSITCAVNTEDDTVLHALAGVVNELQDKSIC